MISGGLMLELVVEVGAEHTAPASWTITLASKDLGQRMLATPSARAPHAGLNALVSAPLGWGRHDQLRCTKSAIVLRLEQLTQALAIIQSLRSLLPRPNKAQWYLVAAQGSQGEAMTGTP